MTDPPVRVAVIGGGIAGLSAAYELQRARSAGAAIEIDLYEADDRTGGVIRSIREDGYLLDVGPDSLVRFKPAAIDLCRELGVEPELIATRRDTAGLSVYSRGRLRPVPLGGGEPAGRRLVRLVTGGLLSVRGWARMAAEVLIPRGRTDDDESLASFFGRRFGREAAERLIDPMLAGIHAGDPDRLSARATFPRYVDMERRHGSLWLALWRSARGSRAGGDASPVFLSFPDGMGRLPDVIRAAIPDVRVHTRSRIGRVERGESGYAVVRETAGGAAVHDRVILAAPAHASARLLRGLDPGLSDAIARIRYASTATVFLAYPRADPGRQPSGHGFLVPRLERRRINGATWASRKYPGRAPADALLARCYVGGDRTPASLALDDAELAAACAEELRSMAGIDAEPTFTRVFRYERANPQYEVGHRERVAEIEAAVARHPGLWLAGAAYRGLGIPDCVADGRAAARRVLDTFPAEAAARGSGA